MGKVYFPARARWAAELVNELMRFPAGKNDDQVDCLSLIGRLLDVMAPGSKPVAPPPEYRAVPEFMIAIENGTPIEQVKITTPGAPGTVNVIVKRVTDQHRHQWPDEYEKFVEELKRRVENGDQPPGFDEVRPAGVAELPRLGVALEAPVIQWDKVWDTAPGRYLDPYRRDYSRRI